MAPALPARLRRSQVGRLERDGGECGQRLLEEARQQKVKITNSPYVGDRARLVDGGGFSLRWVTSTERSPCGSVTSPTGRICATG